MIALSRGRGKTTRGVLAALLALSSLIVQSCDGSHACTTIGCGGSGLDIVFDGSLAPDSTLQIEIALVEQAVAPLIQCELSNVGGMERLLCDSPHLWISETGSRTLNTHEILQMVRVTISSNGTALSQETFSPDYTHTTPNGPGCGECVFATNHVTLPPIPQP
jgi:hypothetical protein